MNSYLTLSCETCLAKQVLLRTHVRVDLGGQGHRSTSSRDEGQRSGSAMTRSLVITVVTVPAKPSSGMTPIIDFILLSSQITFYSWYHNKDKDLKACFLCGAAHMNSCFFPLRCIISASPCLGKKAFHNLHILPPGENSKMFLIPLLVCYDIYFNCPTLIN